MADDLTAALAEIRELISARDALAVRMDWDDPAAVSEFNAAQDKLAARVPRLVAAVERLSELADEWDAKAKKIGGQIALEDCDGATAGFKMIGYQNHRDHAAALREAIRAALSGKEAQGG